MMDMQRTGKILEYYFKNQTLVHIRCSNGRFYNGTIFDLDLKKELLVLMDRMIGEVPILFEEIQLVEPYKVEAGE